MLGSEHRSRPISFLTSSQIKSAPASKSLSRYGGSPLRNVSGYISCINSLLITLGELHPEASASTPSKPNLFFMSYPPPPQYRDTVSDTARYLTETRFRMPAAPIPLH